MPVIVIQKGTVFEIDKEEICVRWDRQAWMMIQGSVGMPLAMGGNFRDDRGPPL
jgi:hypothetical protein